MSTKQMTRLGNKSRSPRRTQAGGEWTSGGVNNYQRPQESGGERKDARRRHIFRVQGLAGRLGAEQQPVSSGHRRSLDSLPRGDASRVPAPQRAACLRLGEQAVAPSANGTMVCAAVHGGGSALFEMRSLTLSPNLCQGQGPIIQERVLFPASRIQPRDMPDLHHEPRSSLIALSRQSLSPEGHGTSSHPQGVWCLPKWFGHSVLYLK